ncbi:hypothetical protein Hanom_Chr07g00608791 [Helianthus anomalus]
MTNCTRQCYLTSNQKTKLNRQVEHHYVPRFVSPNLLHLLMPPSTSSSLCRQPPSHKRLCCWTFST